MSGALAGLYEALAPLRLYRLQTGSMVDCELAAYGAGFALVEELLEVGMRDAFVQTAAGDALAGYEQMVGLIPRLSLEEETRRSLVLYRLGSAPFDFNRDGMVNSIRASGMEAELEENCTGETLTVRCLQVIDRSLELDSLKASVRTVLPAHLPAEFDLGDLTWDLFEELETDWDRWDDTGMSWVEFDLNGYDILREEWEDAQ